MADAISVFGHSGAPARWSGSPRSFWSSALRDLLVSRRDGAVEAALVGRSRLFLFRVTGEQCGVEIQNQAGKLSSAGPNSRYAPAGLCGLHPGDFPG